MWRWMMDFVDPGLTARIGVPGEAEVERIGFAVINAAHCGAVRGVDAAAFVRGLHWILTGRGMACRTSMMLSALSSVPIPVGELARLAIQVDNVYGITSKCPVMRSRGTRFATREVVLLGRRIGISLEVLASLDY
jgi:hypothetical protein